MITAMTMQKIEANSPEAQSADIVADNLARLKALFPELVTEGANGAAINVDVLKALIGDQTVTDADEKYGLNWHGKRKARQIALTPSTGTLRPCPEESVDWETTQNLMIEGDNLEVLKLLQKSYAGKVKLIYIDPPYNTGKDFVYTDNFQDNIKNYLELTGQSEGGAKITTNTEASGRFHTDWLNMMYPRLKSARGLLSDEGLIFISIDENEVGNLRILCDEVFGEENFKGLITRATGTPTGQGTARLVNELDYIAVYSRSNEVGFSGQALTEEGERIYDQEDAKGRYLTRPLRKTGGEDRRADRPSMYFPVEAPDGTKVYPIGPGGYESRWRCGPETYQEHLKNGLIEWKLVTISTETKEWRPYQKFYLEGRLKQPGNLWVDLDGNKKASREVRSLFGEKVFDFPKPVGLIKNICEIASDGNDVILDFFAGSGTTGHAVFSQNAADGKNRRFILVQLPEPLNPENKEQKSASDFCDQLGVSRSISELTKERLRRASAEVKAENPLFTGDAGFRVFKLDTSNIRPWNPTVSDLKTSLLDHLEHLEAGRSSDDILYEILLKLGLDLCVPIEQRQVAGKQVNSVGAGVLMACLDETIKATEVEVLALGMVAWREELGTVGDTTAVFRDSAFENDVAKSNLAAILEQHGIKQVRSL